MGPVQLRVRSNCGSGSIVGLAEVVGLIRLWIRSTLGPARLWVCPTCWSGSVAGPVQLWVRHYCGSGRSCASDRLWIRSGCGSDPLVGPAQLWVQSVCGSSAVVGPPEAFRQRGGRIAKAESPLRQPCRFCRKNLLLASFEVLREITGVL